MNTKIIKNEITEHYNVTIITVTQFHIYRFILIKLSPS